MCSWATSVWRKAWSSAFSIWCPHASKIVGSPCLALTCPQAFTNSCWSGGKICKGQWHADLKLGWKVTRYAQGKDNHFVGIKPRLINHLNGKYNFSTRQDGSVQASDLGYMPARVTGTKSIMLDKKLKLFGVCCGCLNWCNGSCLLVVWSHSMGASVASDGPFAAWWVPNCCRSPAFAGGFVKPVNYPTGLAKSGEWWHMLQRPEYTTISPSIGPSS